MDEWRQLRQATLRFESEVERVIDGNWVTMPMPLVILVDALESEPVLRAHLETCVATLGPDAFDAEAEIDRVAENAGSSFGPYAADDPSDLARAFLLVHTLAARGCKYDDPLFAGYGPTAPRHQERFARFVADVVDPLIVGARAELAHRRAALGPCPYEEVDETAGNDDEPPCEPTAAKPTSEQLSAMVGTLEAAVVTLPTGDQPDVRLQLEALRDELTCAQPKPRVAMALLRVLRMLGNSAEFLQALKPLEDAVATLA